jgi:hypothetical protein
MTALRLRCRGVTRSEIMGHLPEDRGEVGGDDTAQLSGEALPDVTGLDGHASSLSPARATNSWMASRVSLVAVPRRIGRRLVARIGIINCMQPR